MSNELTPKEYAKELHNHFYGYSWIDATTAKYYAKLAIKERIKGEEAMYGTDYSDYKSSSFYTYLQETLKELDKL